MSFVDWQHVSLLPQSFASFYFHGTTDKLVQAIANVIDLPRSEQLNLMEAASGIVLQAGNPDYGKPAACPHSLGSANQSQ